MDLHPTWQNLALRLLCALIGGGLIGINRGERGRTAGLRTTMLLCLAAALAMIQANLLLVGSSQFPEVLARLDFMRLPLGILTGVGFIGAGAIFRKESMVIGVTTAATLWYVTVMGLIFGGGQIGLGFTALGVGLFVVWALKGLENNWKQERHAMLTIRTEQTGPIELEMTKFCSEAGYRLKILAVSMREQPYSRQFTCHVTWRGKVNEPQPPVFVQEIAARFAVVELNWVVEHG